MVLNLLKVSTIVLLIAIIVDCKEIYSNKEIKRNIKVKLGGYITGYVILISISKFLV